MTMGSNNDADVFSFYVLKTILSPSLRQHRGGGYLPDGLFRLASETKTAGIGSGGADSVVCADGALTGKSVAEGYGPTGIFRCIAF